MLLWFVITYWVISVGIVFYAAMRVHNAKDFAACPKDMSPEGRIAPAATMC